MLNSRPQQRSGGGLRKWLFTAYIYSAILWAAFALVISYQSYSVANTYGAEPMRYSDYLPTYGAYYFSLFVLTPLALLVARIMPFSAQHRVRSLTFYSVFALVFLFSFVTIRWSVYPIYESASARFLPRTLSSWWGFTRDNTIDLTAWIYIPIILLAHGLEYQRKAEARELETAELLRNMTEQQLAALKVQLQPAFLFASLEQINRLIKENGEAAEELLLRLSEVLRAAVYCQRVDVIPLRDEMQTVNSYLAIERVRLGGRLQITAECTREALECFVPPMLLQGLAASALNAITHCENDHSRVTLTCEVNGGQLEVRIIAAICAENTAPELERALLRTRARLESLYGSDAPLDVSTESEQLSIRLKLPLLTAEVENVNA